MKIHILLAFFVWGGLGALSGQTERPEADQLKRINAHMGRYGEHVARNQDALFYQLNLPESELENYQQLINQPDERQRTVLLSPRRSVKIEYVDPNAEDPDGYLAETPTIQLPLGTQSTQLPDGRYLVTLHDQSAVVLAQRQDLEALSRLQITKTASDKSIWTLPLDTETTAKFLADAKTRPLEPARFLLPGDRAYQLPNGAVMLVHNDQERENRLFENLLGLLKYLSAEQVYQEELRHFLVNRFVLGEIDPMLLGQLLVLRDAQFEEITVVHNGRLDRVLSNNGGQVWRLEGDHLLYRNANQQLFRLFENEEALAFFRNRTVEETSAEARYRILLERYGRYLPSRVPALLTELAVELDVSPESLDGSPASLRRVDSLIRKNAPPSEKLVLPLIAYVGEVMRINSGGRWEMHYDPAAQYWYPVIRGDGDVEYGMPRDRFLRWLSDDNTYPGMYPIARRWEY